MNKVDVIYPLQLTSVRKTVFQKLSSRKRRSDRSVRMVLIDSNRVVLTDSARIFLTVVQKAPPAYFHPPLNDVRLGTISVTAHQTLFVCIMILLFLFCFILRVFKSAFPRSTTRMVGKRQRLLLLVIV